jgi:4-hydroxybenzoate polyprenyltransferase
VYYLKIIRPINLLLSALAMVCIRFFIITPTLKNCTIGNGYLSPYLNNIWFALLVLSVILINAAGYIINDICDIETDKINKPQKVYIDSKINLKSAIRYYYILNIIGIVLGIILSYKVNSSRLSSIHLAAVGLLWIYAVYLKKLPLIGNVSVALLSSVLILIPVFFEPIVFYNNTESFNDSIKIILKCSLVYAAFAFLIQMIREIIKDLQDVDGDKATGCKTLPIVTSVLFSKIVCSIFIIITMSLTAWFQVHFYYQKEFYKVFNNWNFYSTILIQIPLLFILVKLFFSNSTKNYSVLSFIAKAIMLSGIISMIFIKLWFTDYFNFI